MIRTARQTLAGAVKQNRLTLFQADALAFLKSAPAASYDAVVSVLCLHNFETRYRRAVLRQIFRVLKPGGLFVNCDKYPPTNPAEFSRLLQAHMALFLDKLANHAHPALLKQLVMHELADFAPERIMRAESALRTMAALGFRNPTFVYWHNLDAVLIAHR